MDYLRSFLQTYRGSSFPTKAELSNDQTVVVKMKGSGNGTSSLLAEFIVNRLAARVQLPVPDVSAIIIPEDFPWTFGTDEFDDIVQKSYGVNLGIEFLPDAEVLKDWSKLSSEELDAMAAIDLLFHNVDRTPQSMNILKDRSGRIWFIDHGSCIFLRSIKPPDALPKDRVETRRWVRSLSEEKLLHETLMDIPEVWLEEESLRPEHVIQSVYRRARALLAE